MSDKRSLENFKSFIKKHPSLVLEVRRGVYTWQEVYEDWYLLGEQNEIWDNYREEGTTIQEDEVADKEGVASLFEVLKNMDVQSMQKHVANLSQALGTISGDISQFQGSSSSQSQENEASPVKKQNPFAMRRD